MAANVPPGRTPLGTLTAYVSVWLAEEAGATAAAEEAAAEEAAAEEAAACRGGGGTPRPDSSSS